MKFTFQKNENLGGSLHITLLSDGYMFPYLAVSYLAYVIDSNSFLYEERV
jgi:hypothetical protein